MTDNYVAPYDPKKHPFPSWRYHPSKAPDGVLCQNAEEAKALGKGWSDTPAPAPPPPGPAAAGPAAADMIAKEKAEAAAPKAAAPKKKE